MRDDHFLSLQLDMLLKLSEIRTLLKARDMYKDSFYVCK